MRYPESRRLQAYFDGELDALEAAGVEEHLEGCAGCQELLKDLERVRALVRSGGYERAPRGLRDRIAWQLAQEAGAGDNHGCTPSAVSHRRAVPNQDSVGWTGRRRRGFWAGALSGAAGTAVAAVLGFLLWTPGLSDPLVEQLVAAHVRSLMPSHLFDVASTDHHTVKPWFAGHADLSPVVADLEEQGYSLLGGRVDYVDHRRAAVTVYEHGRHVINVFS